MDIVKINDKFYIYKRMRGDKRLINYLPETAVYSDRNLLNFLDKFKQVVIKPVDAHSGRGVMKVAKRKQEGIEVHIEGNRRLFSQGEKALDFLNKQIQSKSYIVQRFIPFLKVNQLPFDIRVIVQRKAGMEWHVTTKFARIAKTNYFVTTSGKRRITVAEALKNAPYTKEQKEKIIADAGRISLIAAECLGKTFTDHHIYGLDIGIDVQGRQYIIEANYRPWLKGIERAHPKTYKIIESYIKYNEQHSAGNSDK